MRKPTNNPITLPFGSTSDPYSPSSPHRGTDFSYLPDDTIYAPTDGTVTLIPNNGNDGNGIYMTAEGVQLGMLHTSKYLVQNGEFVKAGQPIAVMGDTGYAIGKHLHWAAKRNGKFIDPMSLVTEEQEEEVIDENNINVAFWGFLDRAPWPEELERYKGKVTTAQLNNILFKSNEYKNRLDKLNDALNWKNHAVNEFLPKIDQLQKELADKGTDKAKKLASDIQATLDKYKEN